MFQVSQQIVLASASPRRKELLEIFKVPFLVSAADIDEAACTEREPHALVRELALKKAQRVSDSYPEAFVIGADTIVVNGKSILGKPTCVDQAVRTLQALSGAKHSVVGGISVVCKQADLSWTIASETIVTFRELSAECIRAYIKTSEPFDKAGAYGIQGLASQFIASISGSYHNVVGLDVALLIEKLLELGVLRYDS